MQPETYLSGEKLPPMNLPNLKEDFKNYERFDVGAMGEFDVTILIKYASVDTAQEMHAIGAAATTMLAVLKAILRLRLPSSMFLGGRVQRLPLSFGDLRQGLAEAIQTR